ncbi:MAG: hypothetical protein H6565_10250 [Lewinellaceae bacterium]|nr:hypothetical protein [Lewinellaceae bacterium]
MQIDIPAHIEKLLFLHDALTIPAFGTFTATKSPATTDYVGGTVMPPSKSLTFNENQAGDDGILVGDIAAEQGIPTEEARKAVDEYVEKIQDLLNQREIVTLPNVGRLYKNYIQKIQFLPDTTNFNPESFGLPPLQFSPLARSREVEKAAEIPTPPPAPAVTTAPVTTAATTSSASGTPPPPPMPEPYTPQPTRSGTGWVTALGITLLLGALAGAIWLYRYQTNAVKTAAADNTERTANQSPGSVITNEPPRKSEKPPQPEETTITLTKDDPEIEADAQASMAEKMAAAREESRTAQTAAKGSRECILVVATLREKANADRLEQLLQEEGFDVYALKKGGYQVGIQFRYNNISEVQDKIVTLQNLTGEKNIWIKKK